MKINPGFNNDKYKKTAAIALFLLVLSSLIMVMRMHFITLPLDRDEGTYAYIAWRMDMGEMPYRDIFDHKPPVIYFIYSLAFKLFGVNFTAVRGFAALYAVLIMLAVFLAAKRHFGLKAACVSAALFSFYQGSVIFQGINANTELFLLLPLTLAFYFGAGEKRYEYFLSGLFFSVAVFTKQAVVFGAFIWLAYWAIKRNKEAVIFFAAGAAAFGAAVFTWLFANGLYGYFIEYVGVFNSFYAGAQGVFKLDPLKHFAVEDGLLLASYLIMALRLFRNECSRPEILLFQLATGLFAGIVILSGKYEHYYLVLYAPLCVAAGACVSRVLEERSALLKYGTAAVYAVFFLVTFPAYNFDLYRQPYLQVTSAQYGYSIFYEAPIIAQKINEMKKPGDTLFVWPGEPEIYFYAGMKSMFRQISALPAYTAYYRAEVDRLLQDAQKNKPVFIVVTTRYGAPFDWILKDYVLVIKTDNNAMFARKKRS